MARKGENITQRKDGRWEGRYIKQYEKKYYTPRYMLYMALSSIILTFCCALISIPATLTTIGTDAFSTNTLLKNQ